MARKVPVSQIPSVPSRRSGHTAAGLACRQVPKQTQQSELPDLGKPSLPDRLSVMLREMRKVEF